MNEHLFDRLVPRLEVIRMIGLLPCVILAMPLLVVAQDDPLRLIPAQGKPAPEMPKPPDGKILVPMPGYQPRPGDRLIIYVDSGLAVAAKDSMTHGDLVQSAIAKDEAKIKELKNAQKIATIENGTQVLILDFDSMEYKGDKYNVCRIRFIDGPYTGQSAMVLAEEVVRLIAVPKSKAQLKAERDRITTRILPSPEQQAQTIVTAGKNLEKLGKYGGARENYERVFKEFKDTPQAKIAGERLAAIKGK
jgi:hypothetical protein